MKIRFEAKSNRVKGISFHPLLPWILTSLHNGSIILYDYEASQLIDKFEEHEGPVRAINFHPFQPLFASGGDDFKIRVWNLNQRKSLFILNYHSDYVRTVHFHHELPWIVSASDDQTIRIFNWQNRVCIATLTGHSHYVMSAFFHQEEDIIVSSSLDESIRIWDFSELKKKVSVSSSVTSSPMADEIIGSTDVSVKLVLDGHDKPVNWASFHPKSRLIVSASDDKTIKLWRYQDTKAWEVDTLRGHSHIVDAAIFHPNLELIISASEDKTIKIWEYSSKTCIYTYKKETDRFWIVAAHPTNNYLAVGSDGGIIVFKVERERPPFQRFGNSIICAKKQEIQSYDLSTEKTVSISAINGNNAIYNEFYPYHLHINPFDKVNLTIILQCRSDKDRGKHEYKYYIFLCKGGKNPEIKSGLGIAVFVSKDRICRLINNEIEVCDFSGGNLKKVPYEGEEILDIFQAYIGRVIIINEKKICIFDLTSRKISAKLNTKFSHLKYAEWSQDLNTVGFIFKSAIIIADRNLKVMCSEKIGESVKCGFFEDNNTFIYSTVHHLKYLLSDGSSGIILTQNETCYFAAISNTKGYGYTRHGNIIITDLNLSELYLKKAIIASNTSEIVKTIQNGGISGSSYLQYLQAKGFTSLALQYEKDEHSKFRLALSSGNMEAALYAASELRERNCFAELAEEALLRGNIQTAEASYQKILSLGKLNFLYTITGNFQKLKKMQVIAKNKVKDKMANYQSALLLGDISEQVRILAEQGQLPLAYSLAAKYNLTELSTPLKDALLKMPLVNPKLFSFIEDTKSSLLMPPKPIALENSEYLNSNWPIKEIRPQIQKVSKEVTSKENEDEKLVMEEFHDAEEEIEITKENKIQEISKHEAKAWGEELNIEEIQELESSPSPAKPEAKEVPTGYTAPGQGKNITEDKVRNSQIAANHCAIGDFESAIRILKKQISLKNPQLLREVMIYVYRHSRASFSIIPLIRPSEIMIHKKGIPNAAVTINYLNELFKRASDMMTEGKFLDAFILYKKCLLMITMVKVPTEELAKEAFKLVKNCYEYLIAIKCENERKKQGTTPERGLELVCLMSICGMANIHKILALKNAIVISHKMKNFTTGTHLCQKLLDYKNLGLSEQDYQKYQKNLNFFTSKGTNEINISIDTTKLLLFNEAENVLCAGSLRPLKNVQESIRCSYCKATYDPQFKSQECQICEISTIGVDVVGLRIIDDLK